MVDSNLQRENILPSERAQAYKMKMEAIKQQGARNDLTLGQVGTRSRTDEKIAEGTSESARTVQRYIRLTELISPLQNMVDEKKMGLTPASEISFLKPKEQEYSLQPSSRSRPSRHYPRHNDLKNSVRRESLTKTIYWRLCRKPRKM